MRVRVEPEDGLIDESAVIHVDGAAPNQPVTVTIEASDAAGQGWSQDVLLTSDSHGRCDTSQLEDPSASWWQLQPVAAESPPIAFVPTDTQLELTVTAGTETFVAVRRWLGAATKAEAVEGDGFTLDRYLPTSAPDNLPGVLIVPGSTGPAAMAPMAALLASHGYATGVLAYMEGAGLRPNLEEIPLETLASGVREFTDGPEVDAGRVGLLGVSVGTGGALAALAHFPELPVKAAAMLAPTCAIWQALPNGPGRPPQTSSWTLAGEPLPWLRMHGEQLLPELVKNEILARIPGRHQVKALHMRKAYDASIRHLGPDAPEIIPVEQINCPILVCSGQDDQLWPAEPMAQLLLERRGVRSEDDFRSYPGGHMFRTPIIPTTVPWNDGFYFGGSAVQNAQQYRDAWQDQLGFWTKHLRRPRS